MKRTVEKPYKNSLSRKSGAPNRLAVILPINCMPPGSACASTVFKPGTIGGGPLYFVNDNNGIGDRDFIGKRFLSYWWLIYSN